MAHRVKPESALVTLKEYASFGYPISDIKTQMQRDGFSSQEVDTAVAKLETEEAWKDFMLTAISRLQGQGFTAHDIVKTLGISDEEYEKYNTHIKAFNESLTEKDKLLMVAARIDSVANTLEALVPKFLKRRSQIEKKIEEYPLPEYEVETKVLTRKPPTPSRERYPDIPELIPPKDITTIPLEDKRKALAKNQDQVIQLRDDLQELDAKISQIKKTLKPLTEAKKELSTKIHELMKRAYSIIEQEEGSIEATDYVLRRHKNNLIAAIRLVSKLPLEPSAQDQLDFVLERIQTVHPELYEFISTALEKFRENVDMLETVSGYIAMWPHKGASQRTLRATQEKFAQWYTRLFDSLKSIWEGLTQYVKRLVSYSDTVDEISEQLQSVESTFTRKGIRKSIQKLVEL